jgi:selenocysteine lyase/cysteine desulfurase
MDASPSSAQFDLARARRDTPACERLVHVNNAGASLMPAPVVETVVAHLRREAQIGGYEAEDEAHDRLEGLYRSLARLINAAPDEIAYVENATRAWDMAFYALPLKLGQRILTARSEYGSNVIAFLQAARTRGVAIEVIPCDETGQVSPAALAAMIDDRAGLVAVSHVPTQGGLVNPAAAIGEITRAAGIPFLLDACQSVGQMPIDVAAIGCDMLSATGRKFLRGPRGTGFLYVRRAWIERLEPPFLDGHAARWTSREAFEIRGDARRFENWESYVAGRLGLATAADYAMGFGLEAICDRVRALAARLREGLAGLKGVSVHDLGAERCAIVTFAKAGAAPAEVKARLRAAGINLSVASIEWNRFDFEARGLTELVRASPHYFNTDEEIDAVLAAVEAL